MLDSRPGTDIDALDGIVPRIVVEPQSAQDLATTLAHASRERMQVVVRGGGTRLGCGRPPVRVDAVVSTARLNRVLAHPHGDLTATVEAGAPLHDVNAALMRYGQWLPVDVVNPRATIGGAIATNEAGPLRHRHGTPRDLLIGIHLALTDGRVVKAGGNVVKNVAGYDLGKLISGSFGSLAAIVSATFKLAPLPAASATAVMSFASSEALARAVATIRGSQLEPTAFDLQARFSGASTAHALFRLLVQFASTQPAVDAQVETARALARADSFDVITGDAERNQWRDHAAALWAASGAIVRVSWLPAAVGEVLRVFDEIARGTRTVEVVGRAGVGAGTVRVDSEPSSAIAAIERLRARSDVLGHVVILRADREVKHKLDVWGPLGDRERLLGAVKRALDPEGILNAGRGPI